MLSKFIQEQRKKNSLTQEFLAAKIGVSRPTYMQIENGGRDLTITEAKKLADIFGINLNDFLNGNKKEVKFDFEREEKVKKTSEPEMRISVPQQNVKKI